MRVLLLAGDTIGRNMSAPGIRYWEMARQLAAEAEVVLAVPSVPDVAGDGFRVESYTTRSLPGLVRSADVVISQGYRLPLTSLTLTRSVLVVDLNDPVPLELLESYRTADRADARVVQGLAAARLLHLCERADAFLCASERQRDLWLGALAAAGRLNWDTAQNDPLLERLLMVIPFGVPSTPPRATRPVFRGVLPGIGATDRLVLWGGGVWDWLDPLTVIQAVARVAITHRDIRLVFVGSHPRSKNAPMPMLDRALALARSLDLLDRHVFFRPGWIPYEERQNPLLEADIGVSAHLDHLEARFAFRVRLLDYFWAGLPVLCTRGDDLSDAVAREGAGEVVAPGDVEGWTAAFLRLLTDPAAAARCRAGSQALAARLTWEHAVAPLREFCRAPRPASDRATRPRRSTIGALAGQAWTVGRLATEPGGLGAVWRRWRRRRAGR